MITKKEQLPLYLQKYIVEQDTSRYTPIDQLVWKYIIRQLKSFLSLHGHPIYLKGMEATGISEDQIPCIADLSARLSHYGWTALPVSGFIPPAAFMELQSLGILPIASDMRTLGHLMYTPAPDIVHEAAGHAPILIDPEYTDYLRQYAKVAKKAIISEEDLNIYRAIRELSDIKENPNSTPEEIEAAEVNLQRANQQVSHISEATQLSRMNWWTAEYGLIGTLKNPKIFGAGLLSSVGESKWCLSDKVKKIPLTIECINKSYDITEPQPQLFVTPSFQHLKNVLKELADQMAFSVGGLKGLQTAIQAKTVNTAELNSGIQISGIHLDPIMLGQDNSENSTPQNVSKNIIYLKTQGPTQIAFSYQEIPGQDKNYHLHGYGTPLGSFQKFPNTCPTKLTMDEWSQMGVPLHDLLNSLSKESTKSSSADGSNFIGGHILRLEKPCAVQLQYQSGVLVEGKVQSLLLRNNQVLLMSLIDAKTTFQTTLLFDPSWGVYDIVFGTSITSVYGGPADHGSYGEIEDFVAKRVIPPLYSEKDLLLQRQYQKIQEARKKFDKTHRHFNGAPCNCNLESSIKIIQDCLKVLDADFSADWLLRLEIYEWMGVIPEYPLNEKNKLLHHLRKLMENNPELQPLIDEGLSLIPHPDHGMVSTYQ